jgi:hypothetical protein
MDGGAARLAARLPVLILPGSPYNINCALKTLRRVMNLAQEWGLIAKVPKIKHERNWTQPAAQWRSRA